MAAADTPIGDDLVSVIVLVSALAMPVGFCLLVWWTMQPGGPLVAAFRLSRWVILRGIRHPPPFLFLAYGATTADWFPYDLRILTMLSKVAWVAACIGGLVCIGLDTVAGPKETRYFMGANGQPIREATRMKEKRVVPPKLDKAIQATTPVRDRAAHTLHARRWAQNERRRQVGLEPLKESRARRAVLTKLPTGKPKGSRRADRKEKTVDRDFRKRSNRAEVARISKAMRVDAGGPADQVEAWQQVIRDPHENGPLPPPPPEREGWQGPPTVTPSTSQQIAEIAAEARKARAS